jgi:hypothetical protein
MYAKLMTIVAALTVLLPAPALAQTTDSWRWSLSPLYLWASNTSGDATVRNTTTPVFLSFGDAIDHLAASFSVHVEGRKGRAGFFGDLDRIRLSGSSQFEIPLPTPRSVDGELDLTNTFVEVGGSYIVNIPANFAVIGGLRTFTIGTDIEFTGAGSGITPVDASRTAVNGFGGVTYRPVLSDRWSFLSRADIGGGTGLSWSAALGFQFRFTPLFGIDFGYKGEGVDFGSDTDNPDNLLQKYDVTYYGPILGLNFQWGGN